MKTIGLLGLLLMTMIMACSEDLSEIDNPGNNDDPSLDGVPEGFEECGDLVDPKEYIVIEPADAPLATGCDGQEYPNWSTSEYVLPFPVNTAYEVKLSNCGGSFHAADRPDRYAIDFDMPIGTCITAARAGNVQLIYEQGVDGEDPDQNNVVIINHGDGTFAQYMHLTLKGSRVSLGQRVEQGDLIGLSGSTGLAGYPHLHFVVTKVDWRWPYESMPVTFSNTYPNERSLASNTEYFAFPY